MEKKMICDANDWEHYFIQVYLNFRGIIELCFYYLGTTKMKEFYMKCIYLNY